MAAKDALGKGGRQKRSSKQLTQKYSRESPALTACCPLCRWSLSSIAVLFIAEVAACSLIENKIDFPFSFSISLVPVCEYGYVCVEVRVYMHINVWLCICTCRALRKQESERGVWHTTECSGRTNWMCMQTPDLVLGRQGCCNPSGASLQMLFLCSSSVCCLQGNSSEGGFDQSSTELSAKRRWLSSQPHGTLAVCIQNGM